MFKQTLLVVLAVLFIQLPVFTKNIIYVKQGADGKGTSWADATGDLQFALANAKSGTDIWVSFGTYLPVRCNPCSEGDRSISFIIPDGVKVIGGFKGNETRPGQRDWRKYPTRLSGNIGETHDSDNSYTIVYIKSVGRETILDGLMLSDGRALDRSAELGQPQRSGGAMFIAGVTSKKQTKPTFVNCLFINNYALEGGAVYNDGSEGVASPGFEDCIFTGNKAINKGGAIYNDAHCEAYINYTQFNNNEAAYGACVFIDCSGKGMLPSFLHCTFVNNKAQYGGGLFYKGIDHLPALRTSRFLNNRSEKGRDIFYTKT
ncbi:MAG TPA: hypothetical protein ENJ95_23635 [Bacteroidetes bacterium]|nr:hypothetical protein [Bacteroidota bacterium]